MLYVEELKQNRYEYSHFRSEKLLKRLQNDQIKDHINLTKIDHDKRDALSLWIVYCSTITVPYALNKHTLLEHL